MLTRYRITSIVVCISLLFCLIVSTSALGATQVFSGKIVCEDNIDLSDVEIKIYSSERTYDEEGNFLYYVETYERSVYADADGDFEFVKPSLYCSYTINVETLPANYGISKHTQFIIPTRTNDSVALSAIATAEAEYNGGSFYAVFRAADGTEIYTDYDIVENSESSVFVASENLSATKQIISSENIKDVNSYTLSGTIVTIGRNYRYSKSFDISDYSETEKADLLCSLGKISEEDRRDIHSRCGEQLYLYDCVSITSYDNLETVNETVNVNEVKLDVNCGNHIFEVWYDDNVFDANSSEITAFVDDLENVYDYFCVDAGFSVPMSASGNFRIYIKDGIAENGRTYLESVPGSSKIWIKQSAVEEGSYERTLAHEFMHAIMFKYQINNAGDWFDESFATMAAMIYMRQTDFINFADLSVFHYFKECIEDYVNNNYVSLTTTGREDLFYNGTLVFALKLYEKHGGWATIKNIFENYDNTSPEFESIYGTYNNTFFNFESVFDEMSAAIMFPTDINLGFSIANLTSEIGDYWPKISCYAKGFPSEMVNVSIAPLANRYLSYTASTNMGTVYLTASSTGNCLFNVYNRLTSTVGDDIASDEDRFTVPIENFGAPGDNKKIIVSVTNFSFSNTRSYSISISANMPED